jgi:hypothetical protein
MYFRRNVSTTIPYWPLWVNENIKQEILEFHPNPFAWWIGQLLKYLMRWQPDFYEQLENFKSTLDIKRPYIGYVAENQNQILSKILGFTLSIFIFSKYS